jgi:hypothetical protein
MYFDLNGMFFPYGLFTYDQLPGSFTAAGCWPPPWAGWCGRKNQEASFPSMYMVVGAAIRIQKQPTQHNIRPKDR